jgi:hypothetical protein
LCGGALGEAEECLAWLRGKEALNTTAITTHDPNFHDGLGAVFDEAVAHLPKISWIRKLTAEGGRMVFSAGDYFYFRRYGRALIDSFHQYAGAGICFAVHLMDATPEEAEAIAADLERLPGLVFCLSIEWSGLRQDNVTPAARSYYHAVRFLRLSQIALAASGFDIWLLDMDTVFVGDPSRLFDLLTGHDVALHMMPVRIDSRNKVAACWAGISRTAAGRDYLLRVAGYIAVWMRQGRLTWGIDQVALYAVLMNRSSVSDLAVKAIPAEVAGGESALGAVLLPSKTVQTGAPAP